MRILPALLLVFATFTTNVHGQEQEKKASKKKAGKKKAGKKKKK